jgi:hypothetical protein
MEKLRLLTAPEGSGSLLCCQLSPHDHGATLAARAFTLGSHFGLARFRGWHFSRLALFATPFFGKTHPIDDTRYGPCGGRCGACNQSIDTRVWRAVTLVGCMGESAGW